MKIAVMSDSHGHESDLRWMLERLWLQVGPVDAYVHCGDGAGDFERLDGFIRRRDPYAGLLGVRGNCDYFGTDLPEIRSFALEGINILITHGHRQQVKQGMSLLMGEAVQRGCGLALFGHTHQPLVVEGEAVLVNPGSARNGRMALVTVEKGRILPQLLEF